jgi:anthranilate/para-aminobenzoate synthase component I
MVRRALELIRAGDVYQVNLGHELRARFDGCPRSFFADLSGHARPAHGAYMEWDAPGPDGTARRTALCSVSPELFLSFDPRTRVLTTRPMKGTRPISAGPAALRDAAKDRAELAMIVDLMRNDLGRIAVTGSVRVESASDVEAHAGSVLQATATVSCRVREGVGLAGMLRAAFPAGSITGAPKIRAMQVIDELEPFERGHWCGSIGFVGDDGRFTLSVAIRTATIAGPVDPSDPASIVGGRLSFPVGAGIVADSDPQAEWRETLLKARVLTRVLRDAATPRHRPPASTA